jgi:acyl-CoA dehydrogenase
MDTRNAIRLGCRPDAGTGFASAAAAAYDRSTLPTARNVPMTWLVLIGALLVVAALAYHRAPLWLWTGATALTLAVATRFAGAAAFVLLLPGWLAWLALAALNVPALRHRHVVAPLLAVFRSRLPAISRTEQEALDAGTVWWDAELFSGRPRWRRLLDQPAPALSREEQAFLDGPTETLCRMVDDWQINHELKDLPEPVWRYIREQGFLAMIIPKRFGGLEFSPLAHSQVVLKLASRCGTAAVSVMVPNSLGPAELLMRYGTPEQQNHYLPRLGRGEEIPCFGLTNPYAGSDAAAIPDRGIVCHGDHRGERVLGIRVTWEKRYITLGPVSTLLGLAFQLHDPEGLLGGEPEVGITLALIPASHPGVVIGRRHLPAGQAFQNGPTSGNDVFIPMSFVIGGQERCGQGWRMLMNCLAAGRSISLPALGTAALKVAARVTGAYARVRKQFKLPIGRFEGVEEGLARIAADAYAVDAARTVTAVVLGQGEEPAVLSALLKYQATERMRTAINAAVDIHGGRAIIEGPRNYLFSTYQAIPVAITVEGANILTRSLIIFGQGAIRCHPWLLREIAAAGEPDQDMRLDAFDAAIGGHLRHVLMLAARAVVQNVSFGRLMRRRAAGPAGRWFAEVERAAVSFALVADFALMLLGGELKRREKLSGRFADILGELYLMSCALKRFEDDGRPREDLVLLELVCADGLHVVERRLDAILDNFPSPALGRTLRWLVFPWGRRRRPAGDRLGHEVASLLLAPSPARDRLTRGIFLSTDPQDATGCLEHALALTLESEPVAKRVTEAVREGRFEMPLDGDWIARAQSDGLLGAAEAELLRRSEAAIRSAIDVDDFAPETLAGTARLERRMADVA